MISKKVDIGVTSHITTGLNFSFEKVSLYVGLGAEPEANETREQVATTLLNEAHAIIDAQFEKLSKNAESKGMKAIEAKRGVMADTAENARSNVPVVTATPRKTVTKTATVFAGDSNMIANLEVGPFPKGTTLNATVARLDFKDGDKPRYSGTLEDDSGSIEFTIWGTEAPFNVNDNVTIGKAFRISEYNGRKQLDFGKFADIQVK